MPSTLNPESTVDTVPYTLSTVSIAFWGSFNTLTATSYQLASSCVMPLASIPAVMFCMPRASEESTITFTWTPCEGVSRSRRRLLIDPSSPPGRSRALSLYALISTRMSAFRRPGNSPASSASI
eukprot:152824-Rhodomonas_salina.1